MKIPFYTIDAFTCVPFEGNPAAVCLLDPEHVRFCEETELGKLLFSSLRLLKIQLQFENCI
jgi:hypothetical protein